MEKVLIDSWKGKDELLIEEYGDVFRVVEHRKNKETGEVQEMERIVDFKTVENLHKILLNNCEPGLQYEYRYVVRKLIEKLNLGVDLDAFNGGRNRSLYYFPLYYYPMKILEKKGFVKYFGRGGVILL
jgi:hypothetical protein